jgi:hypothetical protein
MLEQPDNIRRRAVIGMASQVDERLAVHPPEIKEVRAGHLGDAKPKLIDDLPQSDSIVVINCVLPDRDPAVVFEHIAILVGPPCVTVPTAARSAGQNLVVVAVDDGVCDV